MLASLGVKFTFIDEHAAKPVSRRLVPVIQDILLQLIMVSNYRRLYYTTCAATVPTGLSTNSMMPSMILSRASSEATLLPAR